MLSSIAMLVTAPLRIIAGNGLPYEAITLSISGAKITEPAKLALPFGAAAPASERVQSCSTVAP